MWPDAAAILTAHEPLLCLYTCYPAATGATREAALPTRAIIRGEQLAAAKCRPTKAARTEQQARARYQH